MYNRSLVFSTVWFGLCSIILLCSTRLTWYLMNVFCVFIWLMNYVSVFCLFSLYFKKFEQFIRVALTVGIISSGEGLHYHFRLFTYLLICILVLLQGEKRDEFYPWASFFVCLRTGGTLFNSLKWMILEFKIVGLVTFIEFRLVGFHTRGVNIFGSLSSK